MMVSSILTGVPVQVNSGSCLSAAGIQEREWCHSWLQEMEKIKKDYVMVNSMGYKFKLTKERILRHQEIIKNEINRLSKIEATYLEEQAKKKWWQFWK